MKQRNMLVLTVVAVVIVGAVAFWRGTKYQTTRRPSFDQSFGQNGQRIGQGSGQNRLGLRPVAGEVISRDGQTLTVKLSDGSSKIVILSDKTIINKAAQALPEDLKTGEKVSIFGQENADGSVTAQSIQLGVTFPGRN